MIRIYIFTYAGDANEAVACVRCARTALPSAVVTVVDDTNAPVPESVRRTLVAYGARYRQTDFPRCGNLRGPECVRGIISTLAEGAADADIVVKIDSDTALLSGGWIESMPGAGLDWYSCGTGARRFFGLCYAMSGKAARLASEAIQYAHLPENAPEDLTIGRTVINLCGVERGQFASPWTPENREGRWSWWNWDSVTTNPEDYARSYDVVSVGNPRPPHIPKSARWEVMHALCDAVLDGKKNPSPLLAQRGGV